MFGEEPSFPRSKGDTTDSNNTNRPQKRKFPRKSEVKNKSNQKVDKFLDVSLLFLIKLIICNIFIG